MLISGIQQLGVGLTDARTAFSWYKAHFGAGVKVFDEAAVADKMLPYTQGEPRERHAILAMNMRGGGGFELWQYTEREPEPAPFEVGVGDLGFLVGKLKCVDAHVARAFFERRGASLPGAVTHRPDHRSSFLVHDLYGNPYEVIEEPTHFTRRSHPVGGVFGVTVGVTSITASRKFYGSVLGYDQLVFETEAPGVLAHLPGVLAHLPGGEGHAVRRAVLRASRPRRGPFSPLLGPSEIELVETPGHVGRKVFGGRDWGDQGFIHLCFDVRGMDELASLAAKHGAPFTVDSGVSFAMEAAAGRFAYCEGPDGELIEFVETHKLPISKKLNLGLDLRDREESKPLPRWLLRGLEL